MDEKLIESLIKDKFIFFENMAGNSIKSDDGSSTLIKYRDDDGELKIRLSFSNYYTSESDFRAMFETLIEECERNLGEETTQKLIKELVE